MNAWATLFAGVLLGAVIGYTTAPTLQTRDLGTIACEAASGFAVNRVHNWLSQEEATE